MSSADVEGMAGGNVGKDADLKLAVVAPQRRGPSATDDGGDVFEAHLAQFGGWNHHAGEHVGIVALLGEQLHGDGILLGAFLEAGDFVFAGVEEAHRIADVGHAHADICGALAVEFDLQLGGIQVEARVDVDQFRILAHAGSDIFADFRKAIHVRAANDGGDGEVRFTAEDGRQAHVIGNVAIGAENSADDAGHLFVSALALGAGHDR